MANSPIITAACIIRTREKQVEKQASNPINAKHGHVLTVQVYTPTRALQRLCPNSVKGGNIGLRRCKVEGSAVGIVGIVDRGIVKMGHWKSGMTITMTW